MAKKRSAEIPVTASGGNVFADLGLAEADEELTKAQLASRIRHVIRCRRLTQGAAAAIMGIDQSKVSALVNGRPARFSSEQLMRLLMALGEDMESAGETRIKARSPRRLTLDELLSGMTSDREHPWEDDSPQDKETL